MKNRNQIESDKAHITYIKGLYLREVCVHPCQQKLQKLFFVRALVIRGSLSGLKHNRNFMPKGVLKLH